VGVEPIGVPAHSQSLSDCRMGDEPMGSQTGSPLLEAYKRGGQLTCRPTKTSVSSLVALLLRAKRG
jgi:hypothetical protein